MLDKFFRFLFDLYKSGINDKLINKYAVPKKVGMLIIKRAINLIKNFNRNFIFKVLFLVSKYLYK